MFDISPLGHGFYFSLIQLQHLKAVFKSPNMHVISQLKQFNDILGNLSVP